jgi:hypothetical protein
MPLAHCVSEEADTEVRPADTTRVKWVCCVHAVDRERDGIMSTSRSSEESPRSPVRYQHARAVILPWAGVQSVYR